MESKQFEKDMVELGAEAPAPNVAVKAISSVKEEAKKMPKRAEEAKEKTKKAASEKKVSSLFNKASKKKGKKTILPAPKKGDPLLEDYVTEEPVAEEPLMESGHVEEPVVNAPAPVFEEAPVYQEPVAEEELEELSPYPEDPHKEDLQPAEPVAEIMNKPEMPAEELEQKAAKKKAPAKKPGKGLFGGKKDKKKAEPVKTEPIEDNDEDIIEMIDIDQMIAEEEDNG